jgi:hypothetical protein
MDASSIDGWQVIAKEHPQAILPTSACFGSLRL